MQKKIYIDCNLEEMEILIEALNAMKHLNNQRNFDKIPLTIIAMSQSGKNDQEIKEKITCLEKEVEKKSNKENLKVNLLKNKMERILIEYKANN
jgi:hypothetical protein